MTAQNPKNNASCAFRTSIGGQALIEGILMRGPEKQAIVIRDQNGELVTKVEPMSQLKEKQGTKATPSRGAVPAPAMTSAPAMTPALSRAPWMSSASSGASLSSCSSLNTRTSAGATPS